MCRDGVDAVPDRVHPHERGREPAMSDESLEHRERVLDIAAELRRISEALNDAAMSVLSGAIADGSGERPELERRISRARRTVDRAVAQLVGSPDEA